MRPLARALAALLAVALAAPAVAQDSLSMGQVQSPVLTLDVDRLLAETAFGRRLTADILARGEALKVENDRIASDLTAEERSLTERRPGMDPEAFRAEANAFDERVQRVRTEQDAKQRALEAAVGEGRDAFLRAATPTLARLMQDSGAAVIIERRDVFLSASLVDVTDEAIAAIDAGLGDGADLALPEPMAPADPPAQPPLAEPPLPGDGG